MKSEKATPRKTQQEAEKGTSFQSRDLTALACLVAGLAALFSATSLSGVMLLYRDLIAGGFSMGVGEAMRRAAFAFALAIVPVALACIVSTTLVSLMKTRGILATQAIKLDFTRINPVSGFKNLFSLKTVKEAVKAMLYLIASSALMYWFITSLPRGPFQLLYAPGESAHRVWEALLSNALLAMLGALVPVTAAAGAADFWLYRRGLRMEKHEVTQEQKDTQGNPEIKRRRQEVGEELSAQHKADIEGASVILANPTHIAIGIYLHDERFPFPFVTLREKGGRARAVIAYAQKMGVPVVRDKPVARGIYASCRRYSFIQNDWVDAVVRIIRWLKDVERAANDESGQS